jgi:hypothetical protein
VLLSRRICVEIVAAADAEHEATRGSTDAAKTAPSAFSFCVKPLVER